MGSKFNQNWDNAAQKATSSPQRTSRRAFLRTTGLSVIASGLGGVLVACGEEPAATTVAGQTGAPIVPGVNVNATPSVVTAMPGGTPLTTRVAPTAPAPTVFAPTNPLETADLFLKAWQEGRYPDMYSLLTANAKNSITQDKFIERYTNITAEASLTAVQAQVVAGLQPPDSQQTTFEAPFKATFKTVRVGEFSQDNKLPLQSEGGPWRVAWTPACFFKQLDNSTYLVRMVAANPERGEIQARNGPLTQLAVLYQVFVVPGQITNEDQVLTSMSQLLKMDKDKIKNLYVNGQADWRMPIRDLPAATPPETIDALKKLGGVGVDEGRTRGYPQKQSACHVVGYINAVNADDLKTLAAKGYSEDDRIGRVGVEAWGEEILAGGRAGKLTVIRRDGSTVATLAQKAFVPAANLILNLDLNIQKAAEAALAERVGSIVVMDPNNGAVLALANFPTYDPNAFITGLTAEQFKAWNDDPRRPFQNRAVNGLFPVGSTFKVVTTTAALERGGLNMDARFSCTGHWTGLGEQFAKDCYLKTGHGSITLAEGLVQSCDIVFYELGKKLDELDPTILPAVAKGFGFGASTGLVGLYDSVGQVPDPQWKKDKLKESWFRGDAVNLAIGQGYFQGTPLQLATAYAAIANGGNLPVPRLAERAEGSDPQMNRAYPAQVKAHLPISDGNLAQIKQALLNVTLRGTASQAFAGCKVRVAGKTGTAESGVEQPHAWFACYAPADKPKYVVVVCLENIGYGNALAAPTARKLIDALPF
jgi:penicillin-binding protein 2